MVKPKDICTIQNFRADTERGATPEIAIEDQDPEAKEKDFMERRWNEEDGMTESIMSFMKDGSSAFFGTSKDGPTEDFNKSKERRRPTLGPTSDMPIINEADLDENSGIPLIDIVENIDNISERALNMKITKNDFMDCLRDVTKSKILAIKEAKEIFEVRVSKLVRAQEYELRT